MSGSCDIISTEYVELFDGTVQKKENEADDVTISRLWKLQNSKKWSAAVWKVNCMSPFTGNLFLHLSLFWMYNKTIIGFGLCIVPRIIQTLVNIICLSLWQIPQSGWFLISCLASFNSCLLTVLHTVPHIRYIMYIQ